MEKKIIIPKVLGIRSRVKGRVGRVADIINVLNLCVSQGSSVVGEGGKEKRVIFKSFLDSSHKPT